MRLILLLLLIYPFNIAICQTWINNQNADFAISAVDLSTPGNGNFNATDSTIQNSKAHSVADSKHKFLYVADFSANRVLRFSYPVTKNQPKATLVFGQTSLFNMNGNTSQSELINPVGLAVDSVSGTLWILDGTNNRVLRFDSAHKAISNGINADEVLGQSNFFSNSSGTSSSSFSINVFYENGNLLYYDHATGSLWVSDNGNNRVLRFDNAKTIGNGASADAVIGQSGFFTANTGCSATVFGGLPLGITMIGSSLFVSDRYNHRVLRFDNVYSKPNGGSADVVFGQTSFTTNSAGCSATQLNLPMGITADFSNLYVADWFNQ